MIDFHGTSDPEVPYTGGSSWVAPGYKGFPNQLTWAANWARRNRCAPTPRDTLIANDVASQIIGIVDVYDTLTSSRSYRAAMPVEEALAELHRCRGWWRADVFDTAIAQLSVSVEALL